MRLARIMGRSALAAVGLLGLGGVFTAVAYRPVHHSKPTAAMPFENCVDLAVKTHMPDLSGGIISAGDRTPLTRAQGDMLHYRDRGISRVTSVSVSQVANETFTLVRTREAIEGGIVMPSTLNSDAFNRNEINYTSYLRAGAAENIISTTRSQKHADENIVQQHTNVIQAIERCGRWSR